MAEDITRPLMVSGFYSFLLPSYQFSNDLALCLSLFRFTFEKSLATILEDSENYSWGICNEFTLFSKHKLPQRDLVYFGYFRMLEPFFASIVFADVSRRDFLHSLNWHVLKLHVKPRLRRLQIILQVVVTAGKLLLSSFGAGFVPACG